MTSYAIIETGGKQLRVEPGRFYDVERLAAEPDTQITIDKVLFVQDDGAINVGQPLVEGATVEATVLRHLRDRKIIVYKMRPKKKTRKKQGHRQELTRLMIDSISVGGSASKKAAKAEVVPDEAPVDTEAAELQEAQSTKAKATKASVDAPAEAAVAETASDSTQVEEASETPKAQPKKKAAEAPPLDE